MALGMKNTNFVDPCGWDRPGHYSSAADLARLAEVAMQHPEYQSLARIRSTQVRTVDGRRKFNVKNTNFLLGRYAGAIAGKTGTTGAAGYCLVALAERNGVRVTVVLLNSPRRWAVTPRLFDRAFAQQM
jgi:D-alanyl-D-alanine carboxypeptidase